MSFNSLSELRSNSNISSLLAEVEKSEKTQYDNNGDKIWKPTADASGSGSATIRFLPAPRGEDLPWVKMFSHGFQGRTGLWYIENSLTTLGQPDPVSEFNSELWKNGTEQDKDVVRKQKRKLDFYANILVIDDPKNPENNGKVFLYKFGKSIFNIITDAMDPEFEDETPIDPFNFWEGAAFRLKFRQVDGYRKYDKSSFDSPSPISDNDEAIEAIWNQQHSLAEIVGADKFKPYETLKKRFYDVIGKGARVGTAESVSEITGDAADDNFVADAVAQTAPPASEAPPVTDDEDTMAYFASLADED